MNTKNTTEQGEMLTPIVEDNLALGENGGDQADSEYPSNMLERIIECYQDEEFLKADGLDEAVIGVDEMSMRLIYSVSKCIDIFIVDQGMTHEDALEWFSFNTEGAYVGEKTPIWCHDEY